MSTLADRLSLALAYKKLSRRKLAELSGVHVNTLNGWFNGETLNPQNDQLERVAKILEVPAVWLRAGKGASGFDLAVLSDDGRFMVAEAKHDTSPYSNQAEGLLLGQCYSAVIQALGHSTPNGPTPAQIGVAMSEIYQICHRDGKQPTPEVIAPFIRMLLA